MVVDTIYRAEVEDDKGTGSYRTRCSIIPGFQKNWGNKNEFHPLFRVVLYFFVVAPGLFHNFVVLHMYQYLSCSRTVF